MQTKFSFTVTLPLGIELDGNALAEDGWLIEFDVAGGHWVEALAPGSSTYRTPERDLTAIIQDAIERQCADKILASKRHESWSAHAPTVL